MINHRGPQNPAPVSFTARPRVLIDLRKYKEVWEDFYDSIIAHSRAGESRETLESVKQSLIKNGKIN